MEISLFHLLQQFKKKKMELNLVDELSLVDAMTK